MKNPEYNFKTTITLLGVEKEATCFYTVAAGGRVVPYSVRIGGLIYPVDNWADQLRAEAREDLDSRRAVV